MGLEIVGDQWQILLEIKLNKKNYAQCGLFEPFIECPEWGSNPHWEDFKSSASAIGLSGRPAQVRYFTGDCVAYRAIRSLDNWHLGGLM